MKERKNFIFGLMLVFSLLNFKGPLNLENYLEKLAPRVVIGYYPYWKQKEFDCQKINYKYLTHIAHAFTKPDKEGNLIVTANYLYPELNRTAHENGVKVLASVGGWGNCEDFPAMVATEVTRSRFIGQVLDFCLENEYDGVDIDWEFVSNPAEQENFIFFIKELSLTLKTQSPPLLLTMASPSQPYWGRWINYEELTSDFDYIAFMTYGYHGQWSDHSGHNSPLFSCNNDECGSVNDSFLYATLRQIPAEKLLLGVPFFGCSFDCDDLYQEFKVSNYYGYSDLRKFIDSGWTYVWDACAKVPFIRKPDHSEVISFEDEWSISLKCQYFREKKVAGVIIWELSQDAFQNSSPLLQVIGREFKNRHCPKEKEQEKKIKDYK